MVDERRVRVRNDKPIVHGPVLYWMQRDQRVQDNWALLYARACAEKAGVPLLVAFNLVPRFGEASFRHYDFMLKGLAEVERELRVLQVPFLLLQGAPQETIIELVGAQQIGQVVTDFNPLRFTALWRTEVADGLPVRLTEVDAHNVVPVWVASPKLEYAAYTIRPKIHRHLGAFLTEIPRFEVFGSAAAILPPQIDWVSLLATLVTDRSVPPVEWLIPGSAAASAALAVFCTERLPRYATRRNDPVLNYVSHLSPYLHFGHLSAQRVALHVRAAAAPRDDKEAYLEELIVRRELADNFCHYNPKYDTVAGAHAWAQQTIAEHVGDAREYVYTRTQFEAGQTHDSLWNAAQLQMVTDGKMHGFMRMYWAKKILEWTPDVQTAITTALFLNDKYELDGNDPNGVVGVMWSVCGVHDRAWSNRPVFGKVRYMNHSGCKRKFDIKAYEAQHLPGAVLFS